MYFVVPFIYMYIIMVIMFGRTYTPEEVLVLNYGIKDYGRSIRL